MGAVRDKTFKKIVKASRKGEGEVRVHYNHWFKSQETMNILLNPVVQELRENGFEAELINGFIGCFDGGSYHCHISIKWETEDD